MNENAQFFKNARERVGLTQVQVARELGYGSAQFVSNWERGLSYPPIKAIKTLSKLYKVRQDEIFNRVLNNALELTISSLKREYKRLYGRSL